MTDKSQLPKEAPMAKYKDGEYISLNWDADWPEELHVKGHVTPEEFNQAVHGQHDDTAKPVTEVTHEYGRWSMQAGDDGPGHFLQTYSEPGPGRFKLTTVPYRAMFPFGTCKECQGQTSDGGDIHQSCVKDSRCDDCAGEFNHRKMDHHWQDHRMIHLCKPCKLKRQPPMAWVQDWPANVAQPAPTP
jgi:hypothetical protein